MKYIIYSLFQPIFATYPGVFEFHSVFTRSYSVVVLNESKNKIKYLQCVHTSRGHPDKIEISQSQVEI